MEEALRELIRVEVTEFKDIPDTYCGAYFRNFIMGPSLTSMVGGGALGYKREIRRPLRFEGERGR